MRLNLNVSKIDGAMAVLAKSINVTITGSGGDEWKKEGEDETKTRHFELELKHKGRQS